MANEQDLEGLSDCYYLIGEIMAFSNRFQTAADRLFDDISWKQCFTLICIRVFERPPTINELSAMLGSSHQNVKQLLLKLQKTGYVEFIRDESDGRKLRILRTAKADMFDKSHAEASDRYVKSLFENVHLGKLKATIETLSQLNQQLKHLEAQPDIIV